MYETSVHGKDDISVLCKFMTLIGFPDLSYRKERNSSKSSNQSCLHNYSSFTTTSVLKEKSLQDSIVFLPIAVRNLTAAYTTEIFSTLHKHRDLSAREKVNICLERRELTKRHHRTCNFPHDECQSQQRKHVEKRLRDYFEEEDVFLDTIRKRG